MWKPERKPYLEDLDVDGRRLKFIFKKWYGEE
jgi:hypothetical protein